jgi:hypothetical protein
MKKLFVIACALVGFSASAQFGGGAAAPMTALQSGDISALDNVTKVNVIYDYKELGVGAYKTEADYVAKKVKEYDDKEKGKGADFVKSWEKGKTETYPAKFLEMFNKYGPKDINMTGTNNTSDAEYTLIVKTTFIEPGYNIGISKKPAFIDIEFIFVDKSGKELVRYFVKNAVGSQVMGYDYDVSSRVSESYHKAAKMLIGAIKKDRKKAGKKK